MGHLSALSWQQRLQVFDLAGIDVPGRKDRLGANIFTPLPVLFIYFKFLQVGLTLSETLHSHC